MFLGDIPCTKLASFEVRICHQNSHIKLNFFFGDFKIFKPTEQLAVRADLKNLSHNLSEFRMLKLYTISVASGGGSLFLSLVVSTPLKNMSQNGKLPQFLG